MREIKFRGLTKAKDGRWVYGYFWINLYSKTHFIMQPSEKGLPDVINTPVIPETVGQQVGLKDKNGKGTNEVYKDDIAICSYNSNPNHRFKGVIKYNAPEFYLACFWEEIDGEQYSFPVGDNNRSLVRGWSIDEIIGNIHQHPNLMEQENEPKNQR